MVDRKAKLAEKLRANLKQRKSQQKIRKSADQNDDPKDPDTSDKMPERNHKTNIDPHNG